MVAVDDEKSRNRRYIALLILLLMFIPTTANIVYTQFDTSKAESDEDILPGEGIKAYLLDKEGNELPNGGFSTGNKCWYIPTDWKDGIFTEREPVIYDDVLIGNAFLKIETDRKDVSQVEVSYTIKWTAGEGETRLIVGNKDSI